MYFKGASAAVLSGGLLVAIAVSASAQQTATPQSAIMRFPLGVQFEIPQGWSWSGVQLNSASNSVVVSDDAAQPQDNSKHNPNQLSVVFIRGGPATESGQAIKDWTRVDADRSQALPNGVLARWKMGRKWDAHEAFSGSATIGSTTLGFSRTDGSTRTFNPAVLQGVLLKIAGSMRAVAPSSSHFHPVLRIAMDPPESKRWSVSTDKTAFSLQCLVCGNSSTFIAVSAAKGTFSDLNAALALLTEAGRKGYNLTIGEVRRDAIGNGEIAWTEQPGSQWPLLGAFRHSDRYFLISLRGPNTATAMDNDLRNDFLATALGVRIWNGE